MMTTTRKNVMAVNTELSQMMVERLTEEIFVRMTWEYERRPRTIHDTTRPKFIRTW
jgi:hypothetical protein